MGDVKNVEQAKAAFATLCQMLDKNNWDYSKDEEELSVSCSARGNDLSMELRIDVDAERMLVIVISHLPFVIKEDKRLDVAIAISAINNMLVDGCFDYEISSGHIFFRMTNSIIESTLGADAFEYLLFCSCQTIDAYNDKILMIAKGLISIEQFLASEAK